MPSQSMYTINPPSCGRGTLAASARSSGRRSSAVGAGMLQTPLPPSWLRCSRSPQSGWKMLALHSTRLEEAGGFLLAGLLSGRLLSCQI